MMEPTQYWSRADGSGRCRRTGGRARWLQRQAPVRALGVVERHVLVEHRPQVLLVEDEHVIEALGTEGAHDPLRDGVGNRCRLRVMGTMGDDFGSSIPTIH